MTRFSHGVNEKSAYAREAKGMKMPAQAEKSQNTFDPEPSPIIQHETEILRRGNIDMSSFAMLKLATCQLASRHRQRRFRERKRWKNVEEKSTNTKCERFTKINDVLEVKHLINLRYQNAKLGLRWAGTFRNQNAAANCLLESAMEGLNAEANVNQLDESQAEEIHRTGLDCAREVVEKVLAGMSNDVHRLRSERESSGIYDAGRSAANGPEEIGHLCISMSPFAGSRLDCDGACDRSVVVQG
jgi:hypothetical protein